MLRKQQWFRFKWYDQVIFCISNIKNYVLEYFCKTKQKKTKKQNDSMYVSNQCDFISLIFVFFFFNNFESISSLHIGINEWSHCHSIYIRD